MSFRFLLLSVLMAASAVNAAGQVSEFARIEFFEKRIRPLLAEHCQVCHGPRLQQGGLRLDSADFLRQGGQSGPAVVPGEAEKSRLIQLGEGFRGPADASHRTPVGESGLCPGAVGSRRRRLATTPGGPQADNESGRAAWLPGPPPTGNWRPGCRSG